MKWRDGKCNDILPCIAFHKISLSAVTKLKVLWLGLPTCISNIGLYGKGVLELPLPGLVEECQDKTGTSTKRILWPTWLPDSSYSCNWKWLLSSYITQAKSAFKHCDIVSHVKHGREGLALGESRPSWFTALEACDWGTSSGTSCEVYKGGLPSKLGAMYPMEEVKKKFYWKELRDLGAQRISFMIPATFDSLPSPANFKQWYGEDPKCMICSWQSAEPEANHDGQQNKPHTGPVHLVAQSGAQTPCNHLRDQVHSHQLLISSSEQQWSHLSGLVWLTQC